MKKFVLAFFVALAVAAPASAQASVPGRIGSLDLSFGSAGRVVTPFHQQYLAVSARVAVAPDGSSFVAYAGTIVRYLPDGKPDPAFGAGGELRVEKVGGLPFDLADVAVDGQGRLLVFGTTTDPAQTFDPLLMSQPPLPASRPTVLRFAATGNPDLSFGDGSGFVTSDFGVRSEMGSELPLVATVDGEVDSQDRPVLLVAAARTYSPCYGHSSAAYFPEALLRLTVTGNIDPSFGAGNGRAAIESLNQGPRLAIGLDDGPVVFGFGSGTCSSKRAILRFGSEGNPDKGFGSGGRRELRMGFGPFAVDPAGGMFLLGGAVGTRSLVHLRPDGAPDPGFGANGWAQVKMPAGEERRVGALAADSQGRVLLVGSLVRGKGSGRRGYVAVGRLSASGKLEEDFGDAGWMLTSIGRYPKALAQVALADPGGRLLVGGSGLTPRHHRARYVLLRYLVAESPAQP
jgi:uncharacterized delta-60 repeat protein